MQKWTVYVSELSDVLESSSSLGVPLQLQRRETWFPDVELGPSDLSILEFFKMRGINSE